MPKDLKGKNLKLWTPASYLIEVEGYMDESWSDRFAGMHITIRKRADQSTVSTLVGRIRDQAELAGLLNNLYELHLPIISVKNITENNDVPDGPQDPDKPSSSEPEREDRIKKIDRIQRLWR
ncbi:hypothetical protein ACFL9T_04710 [Thermodesulfobacteriota bacterium]